MSADNWTNCHKCEEKAAEQWRRDKKKLDDSYGKIPAEEFLERVQAFPKSPVCKADTLREDYDIGIHEGVFYVQYSARCEADGCSFEHSFEHKEPVEEEK